MGARTREREGSRRGSGDAAEREQLRLLQLPPRHASTVAAGLPCRVHRRLASAPPHPAPAAHQRLWPLLGRQAAPKGPPQLCNVCHRMLLWVLLGRSRDRQMQAVKRHGRHMLVAGDSGPSPRGSGNGRRRHLPCGRGKPGRSASLRCASAPASRHMCTCRGATQEPAWGTLGRRQAAGAGAPAAWAVAAAGCRPRHASPARRCSSRHGDSSSSRHVQLPPRSTRCETTTHLNPSARKNRSSMKDVGACTRPTWVSTGSPEPEHTPPRRP